MMRMIFDRRGIIGDTTVYFIMRLDEKNTDGV